MATCSGTSGRWLGAALQRGLPWSSASLGTAYSPQLQPECCWWRGCWRGGGAAAASAAAAKMEGGGLEGGGGRGRARKACCCHSASPAAFHRPPYRSAGAAAVLRPLPRPLQPAPRRPRCRPLLPQLLGLPSALRMLLARAPSPARNGTKLQHRKWSAARSARWRAPSLSNQCAALLLRFQGREGRRPKALSRRCTTGFPLCSCGPTAPAAPQHPPEKMVSRCIVAARRASSGPAAGHCSSAAAHRLRLLVRSSRVASCRPG